MNYRVINILLAVSVCVAIFFFTVKFKAPTDQDQLRAGLHCAQQYLPPGAHIVLRCQVPGDGDYPAYVSYFLVPAKLVPPGQSNNDTTLCILPAGFTDTATAVLLSRSAVIWQNKDDRYRYLLIHHS